jgi:hypothetical protein
MAELIYKRNTKKSSKNTVITASSIITLPSALFILLSITNKMQLYTIFFITVNALHVSGGFSAHHQELKTVYTASRIFQACLQLPLAWVS